MKLTEQELSNAVHYAGAYVDRDVLGVIEAIAAYDPNLRVQYLEIATSLNQPPWRIVERCKDGVDRVALTAWQLDHTVLWKLKGIDTFLNPSLGTNLEKNNEKVRSNIKKENEVQRQEEDVPLTAKIIAADRAFSFRSPVSNDKLTIRTDGTVKRERHGYSTPGSTRIR